MSQKSQWKVSPINERRNNYYVYDLETLKSYFSAAFIDIKTNQKFLFEVYKVMDHSVNDIEKLFIFLQDCGGLIGYNNLYFDYPILHYLMINKDYVLKMTPRDLIEFIYVRAQQLISKKTFKFKVSEEECYIPQLDLLEMNYYNSKARFVSLKQLQFVMRYHNVQDMPFDHTYQIKNKAEAESISDYNFNDVESTKVFYEICKPAIKLRKDLAKTYGKSLANASETNLGKEAFAFVLTQEMGISRAELNKLKTPRETINVETEVISSKIKFETEEFNALLTFYKKQIITKLKGFFKDLKPDRPGYEEIKPYVHPKSINKNGKIEALNVVFRGHTYVYGSGGIHSKFRGKKVLADENYLILDIDVESYYPKLAINNGFKPAHLGDVFMKIYNDIFNERKLFAKGTPENQIKKIQLNASKQSINNKTRIFYLLMIA